MFRKIAAERPTLLLDEVDALFGARAESTEPIRAILNAGNRPGVAVSRMVGEGASMQPADFEVYCPKVLAGIVTPRWPDTVLDRSIVIQLQRKKPGESVERFRYRKLRAETEPLRARARALGARARRGAARRRPGAAGGARRPRRRGVGAAAGDRRPRRARGRRGVGRACARSAALKLAEARVEDDDRTACVALTAIRTIFGETTDALHTAHDRRRSSTRTRSSRSATTARASA